LLCFIENGVPEGEHSRICVVDVDLADHIPFQQSQGCPGTTNIRLKIPATAQIIEVDYVLKKPCQAGFAARVAQGTGMSYVHAGSVKGLNRPVTAKALKTQRCLSGKNERGVEGSFENWGEGWREA
jgi:hypothetical protein